jgi:hypothetical protein
LSLALEIVLVPQNVLQIQSQYDPASLRLFFIFGGVEDPGRMARTYAAGARQCFGTLELGQQHEPQAHVSQQVGG